MTKEHLQKRKGNENFICKIKSIGDQTNRGNTCKKDIFLIAEPNRQIYIKTRLSQEEKRKNNTEEFYNGIF